LQAAAVNDRYWERGYSTSGSKSFVDAGGIARFVQLPPYGDEPQPRLTASCLRGISGIERAGDGGTNLPARPGPGAIPSKRSQR